MVEKCAPCYCGYTGEDHEGCMCFKGGEDAEDL